ncbi:putative TIR domain, P-loop containing nucleoside triphosphate hydrolase [Helianthus annuus]|uniref:ADP-ribosyl cyclase/cyclic ADP-ribose hydrolase n=1 Tax=Helianthus annuus TaxID=4232 RepID=A0A9K3IC42_HELAN|nr:putative TIR domain, P-loop containing nucleoside triphosphate hydrolase [Helianthus annuus]KAJ0545081.1 putative TIR domain, P-loop containing nucleoside triphosphate hydrolase [Helianthus annuus]
MAVEFMETLNENISANTGLSPNTLFTLFATGVTVYYMVSVFFRGSSDHHQQHTPMSSEEEEVQSRSMASSSSSSSHSLKYEVFLSFRGEDTRKNFVDHLYEDLVQQGIHTYKDDETLPRGESIGPTLLKAIQESRIALVVFSPNYADSSWCLDELACIMECRDTSRQIVMPVFYHVNPSDVRNQKGKYGKAFSKHERKNKQKVESWRNALEKAGNLSGWVINDTQNSYEAKCIKEIVDTISKSLPTLTTNANKKLIGIEARLRDLKSKLKIGSDGVHMVGIWGVGGGGKTTLASAAYAELSHQFEGHCFLQNIREESNKHGLEKLQEKILSLVLKTKDIVVGSEIEGRSMIERKLRSKRVLVVLDDVDNVKQLEELAGAHDWFGEGSRIIITTRDEHLLSTRYADEVYEVSLLSHDEAMELFRRHAYRKDKPIEDYEMLSKEAVSYADGLPLALEVLGSFLYDKNKDEWKCALARLKDIPDDEVTKRLKISYDGLTADQKVLFLDIACFFRGESKEEAMKVLDACDLHPGIGIKVLVQKSLIKVDSDGDFEMHDLIEEMAHNIVRGEHPKNPEKHSRILKEEDLAYLCDMGADAPPMETEVLLYNEHPRLSDVVANMKKLRWIRLDDYPASSFPSNFQPKELGYLELHKSQQKELWHGYKSLPNLKFLNLEGSCNLIKTPDFEGLPCLERLILEDCKSLEEIHPSIGYHKRLVFVDMSYCSGLKRFPPIIEMKKLETLDLSYCSKLQEFPDIQSNKSLPNLKILNLSNSKNLIKTPDFEGLPCLERLILEYCESLEEIHPSIGYHKRLVYVNLTLCTALKRFPPIIHMKKLETLDLTSCYELQQCPDIQSNMDSLVTLDLCNTGIEIIPPSVGRFCTNLVSLNLRGCSKLNLPQFPRSLRKLDLSNYNLGDGDIPSDIFCESLNLQVLDLSLNNFSTLPSGISRLPGLKLLNLSHCINLVEFPDLPSSIAILRAEGCPSLEIVRDLSDYKWLWKVSLLGVVKLNKRVLLSMLEENAVKDRFMSVLLPVVEPSSIYTKLVTLQLPHNWYSDFSGFLLSLREMSTDHPEEFGEDWEQRKFGEDHSEKFNNDLGPYDSEGVGTDYSHESDEDWEQCNYEGVGYVPFSSLRHIPWFNPTYTQNISFQAEDVYNRMNNLGLNVELVRSKSKIGDLNEHPIDYSECWDEEYEDNKTFEITYDSQSSKTQISWKHL